MELNIELDKKRCPFCNCEELVSHRTYETSQNGTRSIFKCVECQKSFSETKNTFMENIRKPISFVAQAIKSRTEGQGVNATCRVFEIAKNTLLDWERKLASLKDTTVCFTAHVFELVSLAVHLKCF